MAKKKQSGLGTIGSDPYATNAGTAFEATANPNQFQQYATMKPDMQYQNVGIAVPNYTSATDKVFAEAGLPTQDATLAQPVFNQQASSGILPTQVATTSSVPEVTHSYLGDAWKGTKDFFTPTSTADKMTQMRQDWQSGIGADYKPAVVAENGVVTSPASGTSFDEYTKQMNAQKLSDNQTFGTYAGAGMGAIQTGLGVLNYFDQKAMNKKNSQLIDQQIANNQDIMGTRKARAADIQKYFG